MSYLRLKVLDNFNKNTCCILCKTALEEVVTYGKIYQLGDIATHYFCLLFSNNIEQKGQDEEGILGFLPIDIRKGVKKSKTTTCTYCHHEGASIRCSYKNCKKWYHFPCGVGNGSLHQFYGEFRSYCYQHRRPQAVPSFACKPGEKNSVCLICREYVRPNPSFDTIWAPCCRTVWFHKPCVQKMANSAGYFFKCPNCNNQDVFRKEMQECGVFIPDQDASWESVPNAFQELTERPNRCHASKCVCPRGRNYAPRDGIWIILICHTCGSEAIHTQCRKNIRDENGPWTCSTCLEISERLNNKKKSPGPSKYTSQGNGRTHSRSRKRNVRVVISRRILSSESSDSDIEPKKPYIEKLTAQSETPEKNNRLYGIAGQEIAVVPLDNSSIPAGSDLQEIGGIKIDTVDLLESDNDSKEKSSGPSNSSPHSPSISVASQEQVSSIVNLLDSDEGNSDSDSSTTVAEKTCESDEDEVIFVSHEVTDNSNEDIGRADFKFMTNAGQMKKMEIWQPVPYNRSLLKPTNNNQPEILKNKDPFHVLEVIELD